MPDDTKHCAAATCPPGCAIIERIGWEKDGRFTALLHFPRGAPDLPLSAAVDPIPLRLVVAEEPGDA